MYAHIKNMHKLSKRWRDCQ